MERLYKTAIHERNAKELFVEQKQQEKLKQETAECTFSPQTNNKGNPRKKLRYINLSSSKNNGLQNEERMIQNYLDNQQKFKN